MEYWQLGFFLLKTKFQSCLGCWTEKKAKIDLEDIFGINTDIFNLSYGKRKEQIEEGLRPSWKPDEHYYYRRLEDRSPSPSRRFYNQGSGGRRNKSWRCPDIHYQFELFAKFGDSGSSINFNLDLIN